MKIIVNASNTLTQSDYETFFKKISPNLTKVTVEDMERSISFDSYLDIYTNEEDGSLGFDEIKTIQMDLYEAVPQAFFDIVDKLFYAT